MGRAPAFIEIFYFSHDILLFPVQTSRTFSEGGFVRVCVCGGVFVVANIAVFMLF